ncbi:MAG: Gfo/Idh/MocA family oxidoreductase [Caldilineaceae bacterium]
MVRWGILGAGKIAGEFVQALQQLPATTVVAVGSRTLENAQRFAHQYQIPQIYGSYAELVQATDIDIIYIATPHTLHKEHCILCLEANKAVLCEKPFAINAAEAQEVIAVARQKQLFCMEAMWMRFVPAMRKAYELVQSGAIGEIQMINASLGFLVDYDPTHRAFNLALGGGALLDLGVYPLSLIVQLLGIPTTISSHATIGQTGVDEQAAVVLGYAQVEVASFSTSLRTFDRNDAVIMGSNGQIRIQEPLYRPEALSVQKYSLHVGAKGANVAGVAQSNGTGLITRLRQNERLKAGYRRVRPILAPFLGLQTKQIRLPSSGNGYQYEAMEVMECLRRGLIESPIMPLDQTLQVMETLDAIRAQWQLRYPQETIVV